MSNAEETDFVSVIEAVSGHQREAKGEKPDEPVMHHREDGTEVFTGAFVTGASQPCEECGEKAQWLPRERVAESSGAGGWRWMASQQRADVKYPRSGAVAWVQVGETE